MQQHGIDTAGNGRRPAVVADGGQNIRDLAMVIAQIVGCRRARAARRGFRQPTRRRHDRHGAIDLGQQAVTPPRRIATVGTTGTPRAADRAAASMQQPRRSAISIILSASIKGRPSFFSY
jgi:hypothetical protein